MNILNLIEVDFTMTMDIFYLFAGFVRVLDTGRARVKDAHTEFPAVTPLQYRSRKLDKYLEAQLLEFLTIYLVKRKEII